jgi:hypothetical protein
MRIYLTASIFLGWIGLCWSCGPLRTTPEYQGNDSNTQPFTHMTPAPSSPEGTACDKAQKMIIARDFRAWHGLPNGCDWTAWTGPVPTDWQEVMRRPLGSSFRLGYQLFFELPGYDDLSLAYADGRPILFEARYPQIVAYDTLLQTLGQPAAKLDWDFGTLPLPKGEWVYPQRGITLFMGQSHQTAYHIVLYPATTLKDYQENLRPKFKKTLRPMKK